MVGINIKFSIKACVPLIGHRLALHLKVTKWLLYKKRGIVFLVHHYAIRDNCAERVLSEIWKGSII